MTNTETAKLSKAEKLLARLTKSELICMLADHVVAQNRALYAGHRADAVYFATKHLGPTRKDLLLSAQTLGLVPYAWQLAETLVA